MKVSVGKAALLARINRRLAKDDEQLKAARGEEARQDLGDFYVVDFNRNVVVSKDVDPVGLARKLGVLRDYEKAGR